MVFSRILLHLLKTYNISNIQLSKVLRVDPSLISKWVTGNRVPSIGSDYITHIAEYFSTLHSNFDKSAMLEICPDFDVFADFQKKDFIFSTLISSIQETIAINNNLTPVHNPTMSNSLGCGCPVKDFSAKLIFNGNINIFGGSEGWKNSLLKLFNHVINCKTSAVFTIFSPKNIDEIFADYNFFNTWLLYLKKILGTDHKVQVILTTNKSQNSFIEHFDFWIPLVSSKNLEIFYIKNYNVLSFDFSYAFVNDSLCSYTIHANADPSNDCTLIVDNKDFIKTLSLQFEKTLELNCKPLLDYYNLKNLPHLLNSMIKLNKNPGSRLLFKDGFSLSTIPLETYKRILNKLNLTHEEKSIRLKIFTKFTSDFLSNVSVSPFRSICPVNILEKMLSMDYYYPGRDFFVDLPVKAEPIDILEHLENIEMFLTTYDNYEISFIDPEESIPFKDTFILFLENQFILMSHWGNSSEYFITLNESVTLYQFETHFNTVWNQNSPLNRIKEHVLQKIQNHIILIKKMISSSN